MELYGNAVLLSEKVLDYLWSRQNITMNNIANAETPGFKSQYVSFEDELIKRVGMAKETDRGQGTKKAVENAIGNTRASLVTTWNESTKLDGNNVDMDQEQVELVRTVYEYQQMASAITNELSRLRTAVRSF